MSLEHLSARAVHGPVENLRGSTDERAWASGPCTGFPSSSTCRTLQLRSRNRADMHFSTGPTTTERDIERNQKQ